MKSTKKAVIKILIACHKPSELPSGDLFLPVRVGSAGALDDFGLQRDDDGKDNISEKNPGYCELTAIYWAWKNLDADYYGLFHYRRFYSFSDRNFETGDDGHMMVRAKVLSPDVFHMYGLNDDDMRRIIEGNDLIIHQSRPVRGIPTPVGMPGDSVYEHYRLHDGTITKTSDIDRMMQVIEEKYPSIYDDFDAYMHGDEFLGYNMFIMKKKYFREMCEFVFGVLAQMEEVIGPDLPNRSKNANRIYGYLAEILTSGFIYHLRVTNPSLKVKELQMIYALNTDPIVPMRVADDESVVVFDLTEKNTHGGVFALPAIKSFIDHCTPGRKYRVVVAHGGDLSISVKEEIEIIADQSLATIQIGYLDYSVYRDICQMVGRPAMGLRLDAPYLVEFSKLGKVLIVKWHAMIQGSVDELLDSKFVDDGCIKATYDIAEIGDLCEVSVDRTTARIRAFSSIGVDICDMYDDAVQLLDLNAMRKVYPTPESAANYIKERCNDNCLSGPICLSVLYKGKINKISQKWNYRLPVDGGVNYKGQFFAPINIYEEWQGVGNNYVIGNLYPLTIEEAIDSKYVNQYYNTLSETHVWNAFLARVINSKQSTMTKRRSIRERIAPVGSLRRKAIKTLLPKGSKRRSVLSKATRKLRS